MTVDALLRVVETAYGKKFYEDPVGVAIDQAIRKSHASNVKSSDIIQVVYAMKALVHLAEEINRVQTNLQYSLPDCVTKNTSLDTN